MADDDIHTTIEALVAEEHALWAAESDGTATDADRERLRKLKVELDRYWDLLRRRRANPNADGLRPEGTVENYLQ
ncbi:MAG: DUF2630 family protein [Actinomycetota bacterium]